MGKVNFLTSGRAPRIGALINPLSGGNLNGLDKVRRVIDENPQVVCRDVRKPREVLAALRDFARQEIDLVAVNGGDGTVQAVLTALFHYQPFETRPLLAVLQSGTTSMTARDVGYSGSRVKSLRRLFRWAATGEGPVRLVERPVLQVSAPGHQIRFGMFFGACAIYEGIQYFHSKLNTWGIRGEIGPGLTILRFLWSATRRGSDFIAATPVSVELDEHPARQFDAFVVLISTLERLFLGIHPYWGNERGPLRYTALRAHPQYLLRALPSALRGRGGRYGTSENGFYSHNVYEARLKLDSGFTLDGQLYKPATAMEPTIVRYGGTARFLIT